MLTHDVFNTTKFSNSVVAGTNPGAGNNFTVTAPTGFHSQISHISVRLTCDANAANRTLSLYHARGATLTYLGCAIRFAVANDDIYYICFPGAPSDSSDATSHKPVSIAVFPFFRSTDSIGIGVDNIQVGDALSSIRLWWKHWPHTI